MTILYKRINSILDNTYMLCQEIADTLECDVQHVNVIVHQRFLVAIGESK